MSDRRQREFFLVFKSADDLQQSLKKKGRDTGFFFHPKESISAGEWVLIHASIRGLKSRVCFEGRVSWRRVHGDRPEIPPGMFVSLTPRAVSLVGDVVRHLQSELARVERRHDHRRLVFMDATCRISQQFVTAETRNLSHGGAYLRCKGMVPAKGSSVHVYLFAQGQQKRYTKLPATVAWVDPASDSPGVGLRFKRGLLVRRRIRKLLVRMEARLNPAQR